MKMFTLLNILVALFYLNDSVYKVYSYVPISNVIVSKRFKALYQKSTALLETDYMGMLNFCLRTTDSALSGPSRSKILNAITNEVFKSVMIGHPPFITNVLNKMEAYRDNLRSTKCILDENDVDVTNQKDIQDSSNKIEEACDIDLKRALDYVHTLEKLLRHGETATVYNTKDIYNKGYSRLTTQLRDMGCLFQPGGVRPVDNNICLSILDENIKSNQKTKTKELNKIANWIPRAIIYGESNDRIQLADTIENNLQTFANEWLGGDMSAQEIVFQRALALLLREDVAAAENAIIYSENSSDKFGESDISGEVKDVAEVSILYHIYYIQDLLYLYNSIIFKTN